MILRRARTAVGSLWSRFGPGSDTASDLGHATETGSARAYKLALVVGFALFGVGVFAAHRDPAAGYEVSIYWATTPVYWVGVGSAVLVAMATLLADPEHRLAPLSMLLAGASVASVLALPVVRNYYFHGYADPMTHLGRIRALAGGWMEFFDPIYPGTYAVTVFFSDFAGLSINRSMLYVTFVFAVAFLVFVPLTVRAIVPDRRAAILGLFSAALLLPVNNVSLFYRYHPFSMTTLFFPLVAYLFVRHVTHGLDDDRLPRNVDASTVAMPLVTAALLFFHPQATVDVLVVFAMVVGVQLAARVVVPDHPLAQYRAMYGQFLFLAVLFLLWASTHQGATSAANTLIESTVGWVTGDAETAKLVQDRTESADTIDVSIVELFVRYFLVGAVYSALTAGLLLAKTTGKLGSETAGNGENRSDTLVYFAAGGIGLVPFVVVHSFGRADDYLFRHVGFGMALVTILGAVGLYYLLSSVADRRGDVAGALKPVFGALASVLLVLSVLSVYSSPFLYLPGQHVSEQEMAGMQSGFEMQPEDRSVWFGGMRQSSNRYEAAMFDAPDVSWNGSPRARSSGPVTDENITRLRQHYQTHYERITRRDHYFIHSRQDYGVEIVAYRSVRYTRANMSSIPDQRGVSTVYSNGQFRLHYVDTTGDPIVNETVAATADDEDGDTVSPDSLSR